MEVYSFGNEAQGCRQGNIIRHTDRRYFSASWAPLFDTLERDGAMSFDGLGWYSQFRKFISYPCCVMDDFGALIPVPSSVYEGVRYG